MDRRITNYGFLSIAVFLFLTFLGCSSIRPVTPVLDDMYRAGKESERGWWRARFIMNWPEGEEPAWHMDAFIAHRVIGPILARHRPKIELWRFHRRAARDNAGHQFSFIIYSSPDVAKEVFRDIASSRDLDNMKRAGGIARFSFDETAKIESPNIEDTSDRNWSLPVQQSWPYFIMGASEMWLGLISQYAELLGATLDRATAEEHDELYRKIDSATKKAWQAEGEHALLHHLSAIFGYEPLVITEKGLHRF